MNANEHELILQEVYGAVTPPSKLSVPHISCTRALHGVPVARPISNQQERHRVLYKCEAVD